MISAQTPNRDRAKRYRHRDINTHAHAQKHAHCKWNNMSTVVHALSFFAAGSDPVVHMTLIFYLGARDLPGLVVALHGLHTA